MKPKSNKEAWLLKNFKDPKGSQEMTDRDIRQAKRVYKRRRTKILRQEGKRELRNNE